MVDDRERCVLNVQQMVQRIIGDVVVETFRGAAGIRIANENGNHVAIPLRDVDLLIRALEAAKYDARPRGE
jgi:hypothetical protein